MNLIRRMSVRIGTVFAFLALATGALLTPSPVAADGGIGKPRVTEVGTYGGIAYVQYDGVFQGHTSTGVYRVPYRITAPKDPSLANRSVLVEPSHYFGGLGALELWLGPDFLFSRGFVHAGIGWSTASPDGGVMRILDPSVPGVFIKGGVEDGNGRTDDEIIAEFARALAVDRNAQSMIGHVDRRYLTGFSDSSDPVLRLVTSGRAAGVFDLVLPFTADRGVPSTQGIDPQAALAAGAYGGKFIIVNSENETFAGLVDRGVVPSQYRYYAVAGTPHASDMFLIPDFMNTTPASYQPELRAHFLQGDNWVRTGMAPVPSNHFKTSDGVTLDRDGNGNAISVDALGNVVPRLPAVELGEAHFISGFLGSYDAVKTIGGLGFPNHAAYLQAFQNKLADYGNAGYILPEDADAMGRRAALCPPLTFTETYRDHYAAFTTIGPTCSP
jgi:hypothetical protein